MHTKISFKSLYQVTNVILLWSHNIMTLWLKYERKTEYTSPDFCFRLESCKGCSSLFFKVPACNRCFRKKSHRIIQQTVSGVKRSNGTVCAKTQAFAGAVCPNLHQDGVGHVIVGTEKIFFSFVRHQTKVDFRGFVSRKGEKKKKKALPISSWILGQRHQSVMVQ